MALYENTIRLKGFLGKDAEIKAAANGNTVVVVSLATKSSYKDKQTNEWLSRTEWHRLVAWGNLAKFAGTLKRGDHISAEGELRYRMISDKEHPELEHRLAEIHLAKIGKLDRGEQLTDQLPAVQTDDQAA